LKMPVDTGSSFRSTSRGNPTLTEMIFMKAPSPDYSRGERKRARERREWVVVSRVSEASMMIRA
jgi:hypothetical protein